MRMGGKVAAAVAVALLCAGAAGTVDANAAGSAAAAAKADAPRKPDGSTPLMSAAFEGDVAEAGRLLKEGADVKAINSYGVNAMQLAADTANTELIRLLLKAGADPESPNADGETALHLVARSGNVEAAKLLLKAGAKVNSRERFGEQTPLMWAAARRHPEMVELLLSKGADVNARGAVRDYQRVATAESRASPRDRGGFTPLMYAARGNCGECVEALLKHKADVNLADPSFVVPLSIAMMNNNWDIAKRLIEAGADVNQWDMNGSSPLHVAIANMNGAVSRNPLDQDKGNKATGRDVIKMLLDRGANPNQQVYWGAGFASSADRGMTPFLAACGTGDIELVKLLLEHGANTKLATSDGRGPIIMAVASGRRGRGDSFFGAPPPAAAPAEGEEGTPAGSAEGGKPAGKPRANPQVQLIQLLADAGADVKLVGKVHLLARTRGGSALHFAVRGGGNRQVLQELLDLGLDVNVKDADGLTALDYAMGRGYVPFLAMAEPPNKPLAEFLRGKGANIELAKTPDWPPQGPPIATAVYDSFIWPVDPVGP